jgi:hypothetical protein
MEYYEDYCQWLDEIYDLGKQFSFSILLEKGDPVAFNCGYQDYLNANNLTEDEDEEKADEV